MDCSGSGVTCARAVVLMPGKTGHRGGIRDTGLGTGARARSALATPPGEDHAASPRRSTPSQARADTPTRRQGPILQGPVRKGRPPAPAVRAPLPKHWPRVFCQDIRARAHTALPAPACPPIRRAGARVLAAEQEDRTRSSSARDVFSDSPGKAAQNIRHLCLAPRRQPGRVAVGAGGLLRLSRPARNGFSGLPSDCGMSSTPTT